MISHSDVTTVHEELMTRTALTPFATTFCHARRHWVSELSDEEVEGLFQREQESPKAANLSNITFCLACRHLVAS